MKRQLSVWAPKAQTMDLVVLHPVEAVYPMYKTGGGYFSSDVDFDSIDYLFMIDGDKKRPDPRSCWQPYGVHGPSRTYDHAKFSWEDAAFKSIPLKEYCIYELHIATFTPAGTFEGAIERLAHLKKLGITAIELMPVVEFPGLRNWGYDGTYLFAPHHGYGGPEGLKKLINACHKEGFAVIMDVVYNHLGPEGNYLSDFGYYFTDRYKTPWGESVNYDGAWSDEVRKYITSNARYWVDEFHVDALRLDAVHAIFDMSAQHILDEIELSVQGCTRPAFVIAESDLNDVRILQPRDRGGYNLDAQWNDDFHHSIFAFLTASRHSYFEDFGTLSAIAKAFDTGFVYDGIYSAYRKKQFGSSSREIRGDQFVVELQNHDQIGNATHGVRLNHLVSEDLYRLASLLLFCAPNIPLLFMGQEWAATTPFYFFTSFEDQDLAARVAQGYIEENRAHAHVELNPQNPERFLHSKLDWQELSEEEHSEMFDYYARLISIRKRNRALSNCRKDKTRTHFDEEKKWLIIERSDDETADRALIIVNFFSQEQEILLPSAIKGRWQLCIQSQKNRSPLIADTVVSGHPLRLPPHSALLYQI